MIKQEEKRTLHVTINFLFFYRGLMPILTVVERVGVTQTRLTALTPMVKFIIPNSPNIHVFGLQNETRENPHRHREKMHNAAEIQTRNLFAMKWHS